MRPLLHISGLPIDILNLRGDHFIIGYTSGLIDIYILGPTIRIITVAKEFMSYSGPRITRSSICELAISCADEHSR